MQLEGGAWQTTNTENLLSEPDMGPWKSKQVQQQQWQLHSSHFEFSSQVAQIDAAN